MARDNFISDNLINIREQLRQDQNTQTATDFVQQEQKINETEPRQNMPSGLPAPAPRMQVRTPELDRERRELIGRIRRDYTLVSAELENMERKTKEAAAFMEFLAAHQTSLENIDFDRNDISRELDRLSWEYYQRSGRWRAFSSGEIKENTNLSEQPVRQSNKATVIAIIISAIMISATILAVFL